MTASKSARKVDSTGDSIMSSPHTLQKVLYKYLGLTLFPASIALYLWLQTSHGLTSYWSASTPPGQAAYVLSKYFGLFAILLLITQVLLGIYSVTGRARQTSSRGIHKYLGLTALAAVLLHVGLFFSAVALRNGQADWMLLLPNFNAGYYKQVMSLGVIAVPLLLITVWSGYRVTRQLSGRTRLVHRLGIIAFILAYFHGLLIGTETRFNTNLIIYAGVGVLPVMGLAWRVFRNKSREERNDE
ncbi:MAG: hypothetical protein GY820_16110 [Gammaproteobacteria bacterium]|nr:hypothetical protein [Gammaproteobacteria bacterium]